MLLTDSKRESYRSRLTIRRITDEENKRWAESEFGSKFAKKAYGFWKHLQMFEKNPPFALVEKEFPDIIISVCHITVSPKRGYSNLYYISVRPDMGGHNFGAYLYEEIVRHLLENGIQRIKLSSEPKALKFWLNQGFYFWGFDKTGSLKADVPVMHPDDLKMYREKVVKKPGDYLPPELIVVPTFKEMSSKHMDFVTKSIEQVSPYYFPYFKFNQVASLDGLFE